MPYVDSLGFNIGVYSPLSLLLSYGSNISWANQVAVNTAPFIALPPVSNTDMGRYAVAGRFFNIGFRTSNSSRGTCAINFPWSETTVGTNYAGLTRQNFDQSRPYLSIKATRIYPFVFQYWQDDFTFTRYYTATLNIYPNDALITSGTTITAYFA